MVDVESALANVQERDNWQRRMEVLERSLAEVREHRRKLELRLRRVRQDLAHLRLAAEALLDLARPIPRPEIARVTTPSGIHSR